MALFILCTILYSMQLIFLKKNCCCCLLGMYNIHSIVGWYELTIYHGEVVFFNIFHHDWNNMGTNDGALEKNIGFHHGWRILIPPVVHWKKILIFSTSDKINIFFQCTTGGIKIFWIITMHGALKKNIAFYH